MQGRKKRTLRTYVLLELGELLSIVILIIVVSHFIRLPLWLAVALPAGKLLKFIFMYPHVRRTARQPIYTGMESLIGRQGLAVEPLDPQGYINVQGELWRAASGDAPIPAGAEVEICGFDGTKLVVKAVSELTSEGQG